MRAYPHYRRYPSGELLKICDQETMILLHARKSHANISLLTGAIYVEAVFSLASDKSEQVSGDAFEAEYNEILQRLNDCQ